MNSTTEKSRLDFVEAGLQKFWHRTVTTRGEMETIHNQNILSTQPYSCQYQPTTS
jgi:hypothetical protein